MGTSPLGEKALVGEKKKKELEAIGDRKGRKRIWFVSKGSDIDASKAQAISDTGPSDI